MKMSENRGGTSRRRREHAENLRASSQVPSRVASMEIGKKEETHGKAPSGGGTRMTAKLIKLDALASWPVHAPMTALGK